MCGNATSEPMDKPNPTPLSHKAILPEPTLSRLPWYLSYVSQLRAKGVEYVSSTAISKAIGVDASQIAKDLSHISLRGKTRIGYDVASLEATLVNFLGFTRVHKAVIVGVGSLGSALIADSGLARFGLNIEAGFDINPRVVGTRICNVPVLHISQLDEWRRRLGAEIGVVTVPADKAQDTADTLVKAGVKAIWNFAPCRLHVQPGIVVQDTSIYAHLAVMYNRLSLLPQSNK